MSRIDIYVTKDCNLGCDYCFVDVNTPKDKGFESEKFQKKINLAQYEEISFFGGEPLLKWNDLGPFIEDIRKAGGRQNINVLTNGILLTETILKKLIELGVHINISFHQKGYSIIKKKIYLLSKYKKDITCNFIFSGNNIDYPFPIISELCKYGFRSFSIFPEIFTNWTPKRLQIFQSELKKIVALGYIYRDIKFSGIGKVLPAAPGACQMDIYTEKVEKKECNRFLYGKDNSFKSYGEVLSIIKPYFDIKSHPMRWFYVCPVGWYYDTVLKFGDTEKALINRYKQYDVLNQIMISFMRKAYEIKKEKNFLSRNITHIRFNLTNQCNLRCNYCYLDFNNDVLDYKVGVNIIDFYFEQKGKNKKLSFFGGEPLLCFDTLKKLVIYGNSKAKYLNKTVQYYIATNFMLVTKEILDFLYENNFEIHVSINGSPDIHNASRDNSFEIVHKKIDRFLPLEKRGEIVVLLGFSPQDVVGLTKSIIFLKKLGFQKFNLEMIFGETNIWRKDNLRELQKQLIIISRLNVTLYNKQKQEEGILLDIDTNGKSDENSFGFHGFTADTSGKKYLDLFVERI